MDLTDIGKMTETECREYLAKIRWPNGPVCAHCKSQEVTELKGKATRAGVYKCRECRKQFTVTVGTIFEGSHIKLNIWISAFYLLCSSKKGMSALQIKRMLGLKSYQSAWFMCHRIRHAMHITPTVDNQIGGYSNPVQVDECYIGGKAYNKAFGPEPKKTPVLALVSKDGKARTRVIKSSSSKELKRAINQNVSMYSTIMTDEHRGYGGIGKEFAGGHHTVIHSKKEYVRGKVTTNTVEAFFALLKRGIIGTFHHVSADHLHRYCDEFAFRWSNKELLDDERTAEAISMTGGKKLAYKNRIKGIIDKT